MVNRQIQMQWGFQKKDRQIGEIKDRQLEDRQIESKIDMGMGNHRQIDRMRDRQIGGMIDRQVKSQIVR